MSLQFRTLYRIALVCSAIHLAACQRNGVIHRITADETLPEISHVYGVDLMEILSANQITDPKLIKSGQKIWIPGGDPKKWAKEDAKLAELTDESEEPKATKPQKPKKAPQPKQVVPSRVIVKPITKKEVSGEFIWPVEGPIISPFGMRKNKMHNGVDIRVQPGAPIKASADGEVVYHGRGIAGYGDLVIVKHKDRLFSVYAYLGEIKVTKSSQVHKGDLIAFANLDPSHAFIHFELRQAKRALDPERWITSRSTKSR